MNVSELFIKRPVMTTLVVVAILFFGALAYRRLPVNDLPNIDTPTILVVGGLPGASAETVAASVAAPLEQAFTTIAGIESMTSQSILGQTKITLQFALDRSIDAAAQDVQSAIAATSRRLPHDMPVPPVIFKENPADDDVIMFSLNSPTLDMSIIDEYAETIIAPRLSNVPGVGQVNVAGSQKYAVRVRLDPQSLAALGVGFDEVRDALGAGNVNLPTGTLNGSNRALTVNATGQLRNAAAYSQLIVAYKKGSPIRLGDLGTVVDGAEDERAIAWFNESRSIILEVVRQPGSNILDTIDRINALLPSIRAQLPASVNLDVMVDRSIAIRQSVNDVKFTLVLAIGLVVLVIFLFLRTLTATLIPSVAMPIAIMGTFGVMYFFGYSIDNLSLLALTLSVGFVVDDAIVMLENIVRHVESGKPVMEAALQGSREISFTILSMTISLVAVFIPVLFMGGILGRLLHEFAVTISAAILVSGFVSLTLSPMLCSRFIKPASAARHGRFYNLIEGGFQSILQFYRRTLQIALRQRVLTMAIAGVTVVLTAWLIIIIPKGFIPTEDLGRLRINVQGPEDASYDSMVRHVRALCGVLAKNPYTKDYTAFIGRGTQGGAAVNNTARMFVNFVDRSKRPPIEKLVGELRQQLASVPGVKAYPLLTPPITIGRETASLYQFTLYGTDIQQLYAMAPPFIEKMRAVPGLLDVNSDLQLASPEISVDIERDKASSLGLTAAQIEDTLFNALGSRQVSTIYTSTNEYSVILEVAPKYQRDPQALSLLHVRSPATGKLVPLEAFTHITNQIGPISITHLSQLPSVTISFNLKPGFSLGQVTSEVDKLALRELPSTIGTTFEGTAAAFDSSLNGLGVLLLIAILVIYIVLGILYEDFIHPITILSGLPAASFGALLTLVIFHQELNIYGYVGMIMLIGIVKKNAILMVDFALEERKRGCSAQEAIYNACLVRFRPIMMTTVAALAGTLPIAIGWGAGSDARRSLGLAVVGGLMVSQLLTLYITPVFYVYMERFTGWFRRNKPSALPHRKPENAYAK